MIKGRESVYRRGENEADRKGCIERRARLNVFIRRMNSSKTRSSFRKGDLGVSVTEFQVPHVEVDRFLS